MNLRKLAPLLLALLCLPMRAQSARNTPANLVDVTANFVGDWVGTAQNLEHGALTTSPVALRITETKKKNSIRLDYTYGKKGEKGFDQSSRTFSFGPKLSEVTSQWQHDSKEIYQATGLEKFAETGYGMFVVSDSVPRPGPDGKKRLYRCTFHLDPNNLSYEWEASLDGNKFLTTGLFTFMRKKINAADFNTKQTPAYH
jgi:hypothetical protein